MLEDSGHPSAITVLLECHTSGAKTAHLLHGLCAGATHSRSHDYLHHFASEPVETL